MRALFTHTFKPFSALSLMLLLALLSGCATGPGLAGGIAPRSGVPRENALALAKLAAATIGGQVYTIAPTGSMRPTIDESSIVTIEQVSLENLQKGDIVVYRSSSGAAVIHRLYEKAHDRWLVLGDNNATIDREAVTSRNLIGRVCAIFYTSADKTTTGQAALARSE